MNNLEELKNNEHLSYSQINLYQTCSLKYKFQYIDKIPPDFIPAALPFGASIHKAIAEYYQAILESRPMKPEEIAEAFAKEWDTAHEAETPVIYKEKDDFYSLLEKGKGLVKYFHQYAKPKTIIGVEEPFLIVIDKDIPALIGRIDLLEQDEEGTLCLCDIKTASKKPNGNGYEKNLQMAIYSIAAQEMGWNEQEILTRVDVLVKTQAPQFLTYYTTVNDSDQLRAKRLIKEIWNGIKKEVFFPTQTYFCTDCPYKELCMEWG